MTLLQRANAVAAAWNRRFERADGWLAARWLWWPLVLGVVGLQIALIVSHRPWVDEWQALEIAAQSPTLADLFHNIRYEGHPPLWYLLLRGLAAPLPDPAQALPLAALLLALPVQAIILGLAPFRRIERLLIALSEPVLFEFLCVSRGMTLGLALIVLALALWRSRRLVWLPIALLPLTDALFGVVSLLFVALRWREGRREPVGIAAWLAMGAFAAWSVRGLPDLVPPLEPIGLFADFARWIAFVGTVGLPLQWGPAGPQWGQGAPHAFAGLAAALFLLLIAVETHRDRLHAAAMALLVLVTLGFSLKVYPLSVRHMMILPVMLLALVWLRGTAPSAWWRMWLSGAALRGVATAGIALTRPFDTAPEAAALIVRMGLKDKVWVSFPHPAASGVAALAGMDFERLNRRCREDFVRWNNPDEHRINDSDTLLGQLAAKRDTVGRYYLLSWFAVPERPGLVRQIGVVPAGYDGFPYILYVVGPNRPDAGQAVTFCNAPRNSFRHV